MPTNRELYQCAKLLIDQHGDDGAIDHCDGRGWPTIGSDIKVIWEMSDKSTPSPIPPPDAKMEDAEWPRKMAQEKEARS